MPLYTAYGLHIDSEFPLSALPSNSLQPDILIRCGNVSSPEMLFSPRGVGIGVKGDVIWIHWQEVGTFEIRSGNCIIVDRLPNALDEHIRSCLHATVFALLLHQRGYFVLHASAIATEKGVIAFSAESGHGKSTTAAALTQRGYRLATDDMLVISDNMMVMPGFAHFKLRPDSIHALNILPHQDERSKYTLETENVLSEPVALRGIYFLAHGELIAIQPCKGAKGFINLMRHSYPGHLANIHGINLFRLTGTTAKQFDFCRKLISSVSLQVLQRPHDLSQLPTIIDLIEENIQGI